MRAKLTPEERFWAKVEKTDGCWIWKAGVFPNGYGQFKVGSRASGGIRRSMLAHRFAYELLVGPIPAELQIDHLCRTRRCVRPSHLEPVTNRENAHRGLVGTYQRVKAHCPQGHAYDAENTYRNRRGWRECRICRASRRVPIPRGEPAIAPLHSS